jgi:hypothetical protein
LEVSKLAFGMLRKQVVREPEREIALAMEFFDNRVVVWITLKAATCIDDACEPKAI